MMDTKMQKDIHEDEYVTGQYIDEMAQKKNEDETGR